MNEIPSPPQKKDAFCEIMKNYSRAGQTTDDTMAQAHFMLGT